MAGWQGKESDTLDESWLWDELASAECTDIKHAQTCSRPFET